MSEQGPLARTDDLLVERVDSEVVIYDGREKQAHCLSPLAATVFELCDGRRPVSELAAKATFNLNEEVDESQVKRAVAELEERDLIVAEPNGDGISRRNLIRKTAVVGTAVAATPLITSLAAPGLAHAASCGGACTSNDVCIQRAGSSCKCKANNNTTCAPG